MCVLASLLFATTALLAGYQSWEIDGTYADGNLAPADQSYNDYEWAGDLIYVPENWHYHSLYWGVDLSVNYIYNAN